MEKHKLTKEDIDKVRDIEGFPIGSDEDIIALSDPPYYTACPNPFIDEFIKENGTPYDEETDDYHCEPFAADVSEGKTDPIYMAHTYHTKVPYRAVMRYILHYTKPGDIVFDGFAGSGMTGVAAQMCNNEKVLANLGIDIRQGARKAILSDLSPAAQYISYSYNTPVKVNDFIKEAEAIIKESEDECSWMYETHHMEDDDSLIPERDRIGIINYVVWSDVFICPNCGEEIVFYNAAYDRDAKKIKDTFSCPKCSANVHKRDCVRAREYETCSVSNEIKWHAKQIPVLINYTYDGKKYVKTPDNSDLSLINKINKLEIPYWYPTDELPEGNNTQQPKSSHNFSRVDEFYTHRNLYVLSCINHHISDSRIRIVFQSMNPTLSSKLVRYNMGNRGNGPLNGTLYIASLVAESNVFRVFGGKLRDFVKVFTATKNFEGAIMNTASSTSLKNVKANTIDYIFTDPPFGANLNYSELSFIWESWLRTETNNRDEAIMNTVQGKGLMEYQQLMTECFIEFFRILKPNRWMTVEFHNSKNTVWNAIQESLLRAGFVIADVRTLDKKQGSFKQVTTTSAVKQDLVISVYKPRDSFRKEFVAMAGSDETAWQFVQQHLSNLPIVVDADKNGKLDIIPDRQAYLLFDRMVAYHIMNGIPVPCDSTDFYQGLDDRFIKRDGMYFLPDQVNEYDTARIKMDVESVQFELFVTNEKSAIAWLYQQLDTPQSYSDLQPKFMQEVKAVDRYEDMPELSELLEENFIQNDKGEWYVPDVTKEGDVTKLREKKLWKEFEGYMTSKGKLKLFRSEAIRTGFARLWKEKNYKAIVEMGERLPEKTIQEDPNLLMYYDISLSRIN